MSQKPDLERVLNFLTGGELDTEPRANQPAPNAAPENVEPGDLQAPRGAEPKDDGSSSHQSVASVRISIDGGDERRFVNRELNWYQIFFIALSGTLGVGLYVRGGEMLRLAGPVALILSFVLLSVLAWGVMQCIAEMLCIWPIPGALHQFVEKFVDKEVGEAIGAAYWFTNAMGVAAVLSGAGSEVQVWTSHLSEGVDRSIRGIVVFTLVPLFLIWLNSRGVKLYGWIEVVGGILKTLFISAIIFSVYLFIFGVGHDPHSIAEKFQALNFDTHATSHYGFAFVMCLPIAAFAFVGVEITAATAVEASADTRSKTIPFAPLKGPATQLPLYVGGIYILAALAIALDVASNSSNLPRQPWIGTDPSAKITSNSSSAFVQAAEAASIPHLPSIMSAFILLTAFMTANTLLYVASRTLYGLADANKGSIIGWFGVTTKKHRVPVRALFASAFFCFITYFSLIGSSGDATSAVNQVFDLLSNMTSVACITVWAFECLAFLRFYFCIHKHRERLNSETELRPLLRRFVIGHMPVDVEGESSNYPWRSNLQPITGIVSFTGCVLILVVANSVALWSEFHFQAFLGGYLALFLFFILILFLKYKRFNGFRRWKWGVSLGEYEDAFRALDLLNQIRMNSIPPHPHDGLAEGAGA